MVSSLLRPQSLSSLGRSAGHRGHLARSLQMLLLADEVRLRHPAPKVGVDVARMREPEGVNVVPRRYGLNRTKARMIQSSREHDMPIDPTTSRRQLGEGHAYLEGDTRFLG